MRTLILIFALVGCYDETPEPAPVPLATECDLVLDAGYITIEGHQLVVDRDGDGYGTPIDCDDNDPDVGARQWLYMDWDGDGYGGTSTYTCPNHYEIDEPGSWLVTTPGDCDEWDETVYPGAPELCDLVDNDCDGLPDDYDADDLDPDDAEVYWLDVDGDGYGRAYTETLRCEQPYGYADNDNDCDDEDRRRHPGAPHRWDCPDE